MCDLYYFVANNKKPNAITSGEIDIKHITYKIHIKRIENLKTE